MRTIVKGRIRGSARKATNITSFLILGSNAILMRLYRRHHVTLEILQHVG